MKSWFKKQIAVLLTLVLAFSVTIPVSAEGTEQQVQTVTVTLSGQAENGFIIAPGEYTISSNEAEKFGYTDKEGGVTTLDALVYLHELAFDDFSAETKDTYLKVNSGMISTMFGVETYNLSFAVNGIAPNDGTIDSSYGTYNMYSVDQALLQNYDKVEYFIYQTDYCVDNYAWFVQDGKQKEKIVAREGQPLELTLDGYMFMWTFYPENVRENYVEGIENAQIALVNKNGEKVDVSKAVTDSDGKVTLNGLKKGNYYLSAYMSDEDDTPLVMPLCKLQIVSNVKNDIASTYTDANDPWTIIEMVQDGQKDKLTKENEYVASAVQTINSNTTATEVEKAIIALNALGYDVENLKVDGTKVNALDKLFACDIKSASAKIFALCAIDAGNFAIPENVKETRESMVKNLLEIQTTDKGWTWMPLSENPTADIDMTGMALVALAPYYMATDATAAGLTEETYNNVKDAVDAAITMLSEKQRMNGSYGNTDTDAMVIVGLASLGIDANADEKFVKNGKSLYCGMYEYLLEDCSGFGWTNNTECNAFATNDAFRALVAYAKMKETGKAYNIYMADTDGVKVSVNSKSYEVGDKATLSENKKATYTSSDVSVVEVTGEGEITAKKAGSAVVTVVYEGDATAKTFYVVTVKDKKVEPTKPEDTKPATTEQPTTATTTEAPTTQHEVALEKPTGNTIKSTKKKQLKITLKARNDISGYQIQVSTSSKFKNAKLYKVKNANVDSKTIKGLKSKKTYYVRIRTYNQFMENNQKVTIYSKWSKVKKLKVK